MADQMTQSNQTADEKTSKISSKPRSDLPYFERYKIITGLIRHGMCLTPSEFKVALFICDRTLAWGKKNEVIRYQHFLNGIVRLKDSRPLHFPCGIGEAALKRALRFLVQSEIIYRRKTRQGTSYSINTKWRSPELVPMWQPDQADANKSDQFEPVIQDQFDPIEDNRKKKIRNQERSRAPAREGCSDKIKTKKQTTQVSKQCRRASAVRLSYEDIWRNAFTSTYPAERWFRWRNRDANILARALHQGVPASDVRDFLEFIVREFKIVIGNRLSWMRSPPTTPNPLFVAKHVEVFYQAFMDDRDPNRHLRARIAVAVTAQQVQPAGEPLQPKPEAHVSPQRANTKRINPHPLSQRGKTLILNRQTRSPEFGSFDD